MWKNSSEKILADCLLYCERTKSNHITFGAKAIGNGRLIGTLQNGGNIGTNAMDRLYAYMAIQCPDIKNPIIGDKTNA